MRTADAGVMQNEPISSIELMERASRCLFNELIRRISKTEKIVVICGPGNNGGDGLVISRLLHSHGYICETVICSFGKNCSADNQYNEALLRSYRPGSLSSCDVAADIDLTGFDVIVDCLFGTGLSDAPGGEFGRVIVLINQSKLRVISIDMPSGLFDSMPQRGTAFVNAEVTLSIEAPKPSFFYAENQVHFHLVHAGIEVNDTGSMHFLSPQEPWKQRIMDSLPRKPFFGHKNNSGHVLLAGGNNGMHGAIALAASACIEHGAGLTTVLSPAGSRLYLGHIPRAMHLAKKLHEDEVAGLDLQRFTTMLAGPGLNGSEQSARFLSALLKKWNKPALLDADALNLLAKYPELWKLVQAGSLLTPHPGEFKRLFGEVTHGGEKLDIAMKRAAERGIYILAKDKYSALVCPDGTVIFNGAGGPELAQGGSGDTLAGAVAAWWARTGDAKMAAVSGMYLCGIGLRAL